MAVEVQDTAYTTLDNLRAFSEQIMRRNNQNMFLASTQGEPRSGASVDSDFCTKAPQTTVLFRHIPLHDLESLWWVVVYFAFRRRLVSDIRSADKVNTQNLIASLVFSERRKFFISDVDMEKALNCVHPSLYGIATMVGKMRKALASGYARDTVGLYPGSLKAALKAADNVIKVFCKKLTSKVDFLSDFLIHPLPQAHVDEGKLVGKRKRQPPQDTPVCERTRSSAKKARLTCETLDAPSMRTRSHMIGRSRHRHDK